MNIRDEMKMAFKKGDISIKLIYINIAVFAITNLVGLFYYLFTGNKLDSFFNYYLSVPSNFFAVSDMQGVYHPGIVSHPWALVSYMFMHADFMHILFNLLLLYWFGQIFLRYLNSRQMLGVYLLGGFAGAALYMVAYNVFPAFHLERFGSTMIGASAAVMAVVIGISTIAPNFQMNLFLFGPVRLKYIAIFSVLIDLISIQNSNAGGHIAHIGGAIFGYIFGVRFLKGKDISLGFSKMLYLFFDLFKPRKKMKITHKRPADDYSYNKMKVDQQKEVDRILEKISRGGYDSLSKSEKDYLFKSGNN